MPFLELNSVEEIAQEFALGVIETPTEANTSGNESFKLSTDQGVFQVKSYTRSAEDPEHFAPLIQREIAYTKYLAMNGLEVQQHLSFQPFLYKGKLTTITTFIEGETLASGLQTPETMSTIGQLLGKLHLKSSEYGSFGAAYEQRNSFRDRVDSNLSSIEQKLGLSASEFLPLLDTYQELREQRKKSDLTIPRALTHCELTYVHLVKKDTSYAILDFEGLKFVPHIFDFGQTLVTMAYDGETLHQDLISTFLESYQTIRPLSPNEIALIPQELQYNYLHKLEWRMTAMFNQQNYLDPVKNGIKNASSFIEQTKEIL